MRASSSRAGLAWLPLGCPLLPPAAMAYHNSDRERFCSPGVLQAVAGARPAVLQGFAKFGSSSQSYAGSTRALAASTRVTARAASNATVMAVAAAPQQKIRIKLKAYSTGLIEAAAAKILDAASSTGANVSGPVPLPTKRRIYCVLRSPHVNKDSREHFQIKTHQRLIDLKNPSAQTIDALMQLDLPAGVDIEVKL
mmetsp:Transcript_32620/g.103957  ORF Transcript_32620/g.103957 Transcript_32620/m.103957 type:complete len:196 (+) Transcript_32620:308-895(+)